MTAGKPLKISAAITLLVNQDSTSITVEDRDSGLTVCELSLTPEQLSSALSRLSNTRCDGVVYTDNFDKLGKKMEVLPYEFDLLIGGSSYTNTKYEEVARKILSETDFGEWEPDLYFGSRGTFFTKDGNVWCRINKRRWI